MRSQLVNDARQNLRQLFNKLLLREPRSSRKGLYNFRAEGRTKLIRRDRLILAVTNPRIDNVTQPTLLKFLHQPAQTSDSLWPSSSHTILMPYIESAGRQWRCSDGTHSYSDTTEVPAGFHAGAFP